jgi:hypothetical protein
MGSLIVPFLVLVACAAKKDGPDPLATVEGFCSEWASRACDHDVWQKCGAKSADDCAEAQRHFCLSLVPDGKYSRDGADACLDAVSQAYRSGTLTADQRDVVRHLGGACDAVLSGPGGDGDACTENSDCNRSTGLECIVRPGSTEGSCHKPVPVDNGLDCTAPASVCSTDFYCNGENCIGKKKAGDPCSPGAPCKADSRCLGADGKPVTGAADGGSASGTCVARKQTGDDCTEDDDCVTRICSPRAGSATGVCFDSIPLTPAEPICADL